MDSPVIADHKPLFSRKSLWIINLTLIPLIAVLSQVGKEDENQLPAEPATTEYSLADLNFNYLDTPDWPVAFVRLENSQKITISTVLDQAPATQIEIPTTAQISSTRRNGKIIIKAISHYEQDAVYDLLLFLSTWLPPLNENSAVIITGEVDRNLAIKIQKSLLENNGEGIAFTNRPNLALSKIATPKTGSQEQLAFILASSIAKTRIKARTITQQWDHRDRISYLTYNSTINDQWFQPVDQTVFMEAKTAMLGSSKNLQRNPQQIHSYLQLQVLYGLAPDYIQSQERRINDLTLEQVNEQLAYMKNSF